MSEYLLTIIGTVLLSAIITAILPDGKTANTVKGVAKLVCVLAIVTPALGYLKTANISDSENPRNFFSETGIQADQDFIKYYCAMRVRNAETQIEEEMLDKFDVKCKATLTWTANEKSASSVETSIAVTKISIEIKNDTDEEDVLAMWEYLTKNYCSEVLIE